MKPPAILELPADRTGSIQSQDAEQKEPRAN